MQNFPLRAGWDRRQLLRGLGSLAALGAMPGGLLASTASTGQVGASGSSMGALGALARATLLAPQLLVGSCSLTPSQVQGPFYLPLNLLRQDITDGYPGVELILVLGVRDATCTPVQGAVVDVWHADHLGDYSSFQGQGTTQMRGIQVTNQNGLVFFRTRYPGWYPGRTPHLHVKVFLPGSTQELTTQVYFDDFISNWIYSFIPVYAGRGGVNPVTNQTDGFYDAQNLLTYIPDQAAMRLYAGTVLTAS